jgi:hypothetical protein
MLGMKVKLTFSSKTVFPYKCVILEAAVHVEVEVEVEDAPSYATDLIPKIQIFKHFLGNYKDPLRFKYLNER